MIVFELICRDQHRFEGWFSSGDDFSSQQSRGLLECPICGGAHVEKLPTAKIRKQQEPTPQATDNSSQTSVATPVDAARVIDYILTHSEDVGKSFAEEARRIYYQQAPQRSIRGVATRSEAEDLHEEGVPVFSLPIPPKDHWN